MTKGHNNTDSGFSLESASLPEADIADEESRPGNAQVEHVAV